MRAQVDLCGYTQSGFLKFVLSIQLLQFLTIRPILLVEFLEAFEDGFFNEDDFDLIEASEDW